MRINFIVSLILGLLVVSCKTSFRISVKEPSVVKLANNIQNFGIINNVNNDNSPEKIISVALGAQTLNGNVLAAERASDGVLRALGNSSFMQGEIIPITSNMRNKDAELNWSILDSIAKTKKLDGFFELSELRTISPVGGTILAGASGKTSARLDGTLFVTIHISETGQKYERFSVNQHYNIPLSGTINILDILNDAVRKREYYRALGFELGYKAGRLISPNWVWVGRTYYTKGHRTIKRAKSMIKNGNWDIAEKQLIQDEDYGKEKIRGRILYNLALVNEGQGEIDNAIMYAERSALECGNKLANDYIEKLRKRKRIIDKMNEQ